MRQSSAGSLDSIPGSETSSLSDHSRDLSRSEEESSVSKPSEPSPLRDKQDEIKDITPPSDDVMPTSGEAENEEQAEEEKKDEEKDDKVGELEGDEMTQDHQQTIECKEGKEEQKDDDKGSIEGKEETMEDEQTTNNDNIESEDTVFDTNDVRDVEESSQEGLVKSSEEHSDEVQDDVKPTDDVAVEDKDVTRDASSPDRDGGVSEVADTTGFVHETEADTDKYSSKFDDILDKLEESEDTADENEIVENEVEEKGSVENNKLHETITDHEKIETSAKEDESDKITANGDVTEEKEVEESKTEVAEEETVDESKTADNVKEREKDTKDEDRNEHSHNSPLKQLTPSKILFLRSGFFIVFKCNIYQLLLFVEGKEPLSNGVADKPSPAKQVT